MTKKKSSVSNVRTPLNMFAQRAYEMAREKGFWRGEAADVGLKLLLIHSEVSEATEEYRKNGTDRLEYVVAEKMAFPALSLFNPSKHPMPPTLPAYVQKPEGLATELADVLIRTIDLMYALGLNVEDVVKRKMEYNATRGKMHGGKRF